MTLSDVLAKLKPCCLGKGRAWRAGEFFDQLDHLSDSKIFSELYQQQVTERAYPEYKQLLTDLGVVYRNNQKVKINTQAPLAHIRKRIGSGR